jgi:hypothetical protein
MWRLHREGTGQRDPSNGGGWASGHARVPGSPFPHSRQPHLPFDTFPVQPGVPARGDPTLAPLPNPPGCPLSPSA